MLLVNCKVERKRGHQNGVPMPGKYGLGVRTKTVRVPETIADNIKDVLESFDAIKTLVDDWQENVEHTTSPRYDQAKKLLVELRKLL